jgi:glycosyltransferase involved in cell wall biosynthesis
MHKVTLAMPIYNVEKYIEKALLSALNQTFESIEYILVDDKGTDKSIDIAKNIIKNHPRGKDVRIIDHGVNRGTGATKNTAIDNAQGEFLYFMDSDDEITPDCISILYSAMMETPVDFVAASNEFVYITYDKKRMARNGYVYEEKLINDGTFPVAKAYYLDGIFIKIYTWNKLYNLQFIKKNRIRCIPDHLNEDVYFSYQVVLRAQSCRLLSDKTYLYYERENSTVTKHRHSGFTTRIGKQYDEIIRLKTIFSQNFKDCIFYSVLLRSNYQFAVYNALAIYKSKKIPLAERCSYANTMLKYPIPYKEALNLPDKPFHIPMLLISKIPLLVIRFFFLRSWLKVLSLLKMYKYYY